VAVSLDHVGERKEPKIRGRAKRPKNRNAKLEEEEEAMEET